MYHSNKIIASFFGISVFCGHLNFLCALISERVFARAHVQFGGDVSNGSVFPTGTITL